ncbi:MAG TPA: response regulator transcription factor [Mycobacteriales bacterium]|jgi:DNA-binding NarL/FixJ family response regulator|nr:response regulator transcription factor [Mycobacteriales bacterium]
MTESVLAPPRRVAIVDDHAAFADLLGIVLDELDDLECVGSAGSLADALALVARTRPDIVVVDLALGEDDGLEVVRQLRAERVDLVLVVASARSDAYALANVAVAGANGFAPKRGAFGELLTILRSARPGTMSVAPTLLPAPKVMAISADDDGWPVRLTAREAEVLALMGRGAGVPGIARVLNISLNTCRSHVRAVHSKLGVATQLEAVLKARRIGLLQPPDEL